MKIAFISSILPRECGIATFTNDLMKAMFNSPRGLKHDSIAIAINEPENKCKYPDAVKYIVRQHHQEDYIKAAEYLNNTADVCFLQHEFNLFGGDEGDMILVLLKNLKIPLITNFHTVLHNPSKSQKHILLEITRISQKVVVMSQTASEFCKSIYHIPSQKLIVISHGIPEIPISHEEARKQLQIPLNKKVITSFGLLTRNKGVEIVLKALPVVIEKHPNVNYLILGKTHPVIKKMYGEKYRRFLEKLSSDLNISDQIIFRNKFISEKELVLYLAATDILITSYRNKDQVSSGPLTFAMGARTAVVSTPFWNAQELLAHGRGELFGFNDSGRLEEILIDLLDHPDKLDKLKEKAYQFGKEITWPKIGAKYISLTERIVNQFNKDRRAALIA
jgi:glycosyltransferase involved in cell wall biosynthesis